MDRTITEIFDELGIEYVVTIPDEGGIDIHIPEQVIHQD